MVELLDLEPGGADQPVDRTVEVAAAREAALDRIEAVLPGDDVRLVREAVLEEVEATTRAEHAPDFSERDVYLRDRAQGEGRGDRVH